MSTITEAVLRLRGGAAASWMLAVVAGVASAAGAPSAVEPYGFGATPTDVRQAALVAR